METFFSAKELANILGYHVETVRKMIRDGKIKAIRLNEKGDYRISEKELIKLRDGFLTKGVEK